MRDGVDYRVESHGTALDAIGATVAHAAGWTGDGIVIGFPDYGFDLAHPTFASTARSGRSRFAAFRSQPDRIDFRDPGGISTAELPGYDPHANYYGTHRRVPANTGAHGTLMASIAAGTATPDHLGVAPDATLVGVHLDLPDTAWQERNGSSRPDWLSWDPTTDPVWRGWKCYADHPAIADALDYISNAGREFRAAGIVVNLSVGTWAGPHDGRSAVCRKIDQIVAAGEAGDGPPITVVVGSGNAGTDRGHVEGRLVTGVSRDIVWQFDPRSTGTEKLEVWIENVGSGPDDALDCWLVAPADRRGEPLAFPITPSRTTSVEITGMRVGVADLTSRATPSLAHLRLSLDPSLCTGRLPRDDAGLIAWRVRIGLREGCPPRRFNAWRERNDHPYRSTLADSTPASTLCDFACATHAIVVGAYDHNAASEADPLPFSSRGPLPWSDPRSFASQKRFAPHLTAPGHRIVGARSGTRAYCETSGTSAAAALVSGSVALLYQQAAAAGIRLDHSALVSLLAGPSTSAGRQRPDPALGLGPATIADLTGAIR